MALDILHDNWGPYTHTEVENALKAYLSGLEDRINQAIQSGGVGLTDLSAEVQALLNKADTALQSETDPTVPNWAKQSNKPTYNVAEIIYSSNRPLSSKLDEMAAEILAAGATDSEMSDSSKKPVQNKVIKAYVDAAVLTLQNALNALMNGQSVTDAIDTFNEIVDFLDGIDTDDPTLANQLLTLRNAINNAGKVKSVTINGTNHTPDSSGIIDLGTIQGAQGPKGDTGNVQVDGNGNVLIVNNLEEGGTGAALSAEMGKRLALLAGTYAEAWARSKVITVPFCWLWVETVNGAAISKPIWHKGNSVFVDATGAIINVPAASVPAAPTITGATSGSTVPKNTQITITPTSGSALYYSIDGGSTYQTSDRAVTLTLATAGSVSIVAYCANNKGNSSNATLSVIVAGTAVPTFSPNGGEVARGGSVTISVPAGGELHYKIDSGSWITASGTSVSIPITGAPTIQAYNVQDGDTSSTITKSFTLAALASPTFSVATGTEFPATGGSVEFTGPTGATIYYTTDGSTPTTSSTQYTGTAIAVNADMTIKAIAVDQWGSSDVATASYTVAIDHKFQFKIALTGDNSTEYVPITNIGAPKYNMTVDWGDGTTTDYSSNGADKIGVKKDCGHAYVGNAGDEFIITIRGTRCDMLLWRDTSCCNPAALVAILDNTLECGTAHGTAANGGFGANLESLSANALSNNTYGHISFRDTKLTSLPDGLLSHLTKSGYNLTSCNNMFMNMSISITASQMNELKGAIVSVTNFENMFYGLNGTVHIPDDFFDLVAGSSVTTCEYMTHLAKSGLTGDAKALYDVLSTKVTSSATTKGCFNAASLTNRNQVPNAWGGTAG